MPKRAPRTTGEYVAGQSEAAFQAAIVEMARALGWLVFHDNDSRGNESGFPDLVMVHGRHQRILFVELKTKVGRLRPAQEEWLVTLASACSMPGPAAVIVWRPQDWPEIEEVLRGGR